MTKAAFDKIMAGVNDAIAYVHGTADKSGYGIHIQPVCILDEPDDAEPIKGVADA